jgi:hypothetical protein
MSDLPLPPSCGPATTLSNDDLVDVALQSTARYALPSRTAASRRSR